MATTHQLQSQAANARETVATIRAGTAQQTMAAAATAASSAAAPLF
ncbi:hypothetical protein ACFVTY_24560 [Streptomyces sp. NPDC058067]